MSKKANPTSIGLFFAVGIALGIAALLLFSSRRLFHPQQKSIIYFDSSLKGLNPGAPVKFRGVTIGSVEEILIRHNQAETDFAMPVIITIDKKLAQSRSDQNLQIGNPAKLNEFIRQGFRARLDSESLVTGILYVDLEMIYNPPLPEFHQLTPEYHEIPSIRSDVQKLLADLGHVDIRGICQKLDQLLTRVDSIVGQLDVAGISAGATNLLGAAQRLVTTPDLTNSITSLRQTLDHAGALLKRIDGRVDPLADSMEVTLADARKTLADLRVSLQNVSEMLGPDSNLRPDLTQALEEVGNAFRAVADLAEFLQRHPNALLTGARKGKKQQ